MNRPLNGALDGPGFLRMRILAGALCGAILAVIPGLRAADIEPLGKFRDCDTCPEMIAVPPGKFLMGPPRDEPHFPEEEPQHYVEIFYPLAVGIYEVTRGEFAAFVAESRHNASGGCRNAFGSETPAPKDWQAPGFEQTPRDPVVCVSYDDARAYIDWLSKKTGKAYRLPTEAEWEYAARADTNTPFYFGATIGTDEANFNGRNHDDFGKDNGIFRGKTVPVGGFAPNGYGLYDMNGNALELTEDCFNDNYYGAPVDGSARRDGDCNARVLRGGGWTNHASGLKATRRTFRGNANRANDIGFRVARPMK